MIDSKRSIEACAQSYGSDADAMRDYLSEGEKRALSLDNRGPITFDSDGNLSKSIREAYSKYGFYIFENVLSEQELEDIKDDLELYVDLVGRTHLKHVNQEHQVNTYVLKHFMTVKHSLEHFLSDPDYASGNGKVSFGSALGLESVLRDYDCTLNDGDGGFKGNKGDCRKIYKAIELGNLTEDELLSSIGLADEWSAYQNSNIDNPYKCFSEVLS